MHDRNTAEGVEVGKTGDQCVEGNEYNQPSEVMLYIIPWLLNKAAETRVSWGRGAGVYRLDHCSVDDEFMRITIVILFALSPMTISARWKWCNF